IISPYGFHIKSNEKITGDFAKSESGARWISKSIHTKDELYENNNDLNIDAFVIGTIYKSNSHPNGPTLGIEKFMELVRLSKKPVIGIGGINLQNIDAIKKSSAIGVAMISELVNTNNLEKTINKLKYYYD
ncbi:MAG: thiamine phosphate synthase, partial [Chloroflexota bacterium]|nr:thiamine phosphate synthase [Chloroflexota bacterium]